MNPPETDTELLEATWSVYTDEFADHVGEIVTPEEVEMTEEAVEWAAQVFMFGYGLGSIAGAATTTPDEYDRETDLTRVHDIVDTVTDIAASDDFDVSSQRVKTDFFE